MRWHEPALSMHRSRPEEHAYLNTLAFAELRLGRIDDAIALFNRCVAIPRSDGRPEHPIDQLGLALAHATAGRRELALASLNAARRVIASNSYPPDGELDWFIAEIAASLRSLDAPGTRGPGGGRGRRCAGRAAGARGPPPRRRRWRPTASAARPCTTLGAARRP